MTTITPPDYLPIKRIQWSLRQPAQVNRSGWTGRRQVLGLPGGALWTASVEFLPIRLEAQFRKWRGLLAQMQGQFNTLQLPASEEDQHTGSYTVRVNGGSQTGRTLVIDGLPNSTTLLTKGAFLSIAGTNQLVVLTADLTSNGAGQASASIEPALRASPTDNALVETKNPVALMALASDTISWGVDVGQLYGFSLDMEEAF